MYNANDVVAADNKDVIVKVTVVIDGTDTVILGQDVIVTNTAPAISSAKWVTTATAIVENDVLKITSTNAGTIANLTGTLELKDQYGESITFNGTVIFTNKVDASGSN